MPCCIDRMRFSLRFTIRKKKATIAFFFFSFFAKCGTCTYAARRAYRLRIRAFFLHWKQWLTCERDSVKRAFNSGVATHSR